MPKADAAQQSFGKAIEVELRQKAKSWERVTTSPARLRRDTGGRQEARAMLLEIHNWFTQGFGTADLKDPRALPVELSNSAVNLRAPPALTPS